MKVNKVLLKSASVLFGVATLSNIAMANNYAYLDEGISKIDFSTTDENISNEISKEDEILSAINDLENDYTKENVHKIESLIDSIEDKSLQLTLENKLKEAISVLTISNMTANIDVYVQSENVLTMSLDTNYILFDNFDGINDMEKSRAINITVNSTLPYEVSATLVTEITGSNPQNIMDKEILNIKESTSDEYKSFSTVGDKIILSDVNPPATDVNHYIDFKLKGRIPYTIDVYKAVVQFEVQQK